ncbi:AraC family transcriptional regulator [Cupriavidus sp. WKF15]|uniref:AraC family transcriptional regulator n=1 Tax=Cupriavidus sp. WKF15 TaxID=3032282 RepID=UPI0023E09FE6|nr:AraC family transcriptional regulator [Cupriavidus sp. WKF15]WER46051.1 AraC family transcriptional regulator [Cupriavidus sp. WKF15]
MTTQVRAAALTGYFDVASQLELDTEPILRAAGVSRALLDDPDQRIPVTSVMSLLDEAARASGCESFGLRMAATRQLADLGAISLLLMHQATLRDALRTLIRYRSLMNESLAMLVEDAGTTVIVREEIVLEDAPVSRQAIELATGTLHRACSVLLGPQWNPHSVHFTHDAPADLQLHQRIFGCKLKFHSEFNGIACATADLDHPNPIADPMMAEYARRCLEAQSVACATSCVLEVRKAIYLLLPMGHASIEQVARGLEMEVRTLQRRLKSAGTVFSQQVNDVRRELVVRYLVSGGHLLAEVAELLGFSMPSSFTRWFSAEFGVAPSQWRQRLVQADATAEGRRPVCLRHG